MESQKVSESKKSLETITILVVDDDATCLTIVAAILRTFRYEVVTVKHPTDALSTLRFSGGAFDLVVSDVHMPDMNGFELQQAILQEFNLPVVLMSADDKKGVPLKGLETGASSFIMKPVSRNALKNLCQLAASAKKKTQVVFEETGDEKTNNSEEGSGFASPGTELDTSAAKTDAKRKSPRKEDTDDKSAGISKNPSQKKPKVVWNNALHNKFLEAIRNIGLDRAVPKRILQEMKVPGLTRENIASHLQKYRIFLRRVSDATCKMQYALDEGSPIRPVLTPGFGQSRLVTNKGSLLTNSHTQTRNLSQQVDHTNFIPIGTHDVLSRTISNAPLPIRHQSNYVGYNMLNLQQHATSTEPQGQIDNQLDDIAVASPQSEFLDIDKILQHIGTFSSSSSSNQTYKNTRAEKLPGIVEEFQMSLAPNTNHLTTEGEEIHLASSFSPFTGLSNFDIMSVEQCPEEGDVNSFGFTVNAPNEARQNDVGTGLTSELFSATIHRETNFIPTSHQDTSQGNGNLSTSAGNGITSHLPINVLVPPTEYEDDDFLESLLAPSLYDEDHITLDGIY